MTKKIPNEKLSKHENSFLIKNGVLVTMDASKRVLNGDIRVTGNKISEIGNSITPAGGEPVVDANNNFIIPGLIQCHTHLCQTLFRGLADDLSLLDWLTKKIWPFESSHNEQSMIASSLIGIDEMQRLGTTTILDMGSTRLTDPIFESAISSNMRYVGGNCWADLKDFSGPLFIDTKETIKETERLIKKYHNFSDLIEFALCPRFAVSCSHEILLWGSSIQKEQQLKIHTHASENFDEIKLIKERTGKDNVEYLESCDYLNPNTIIVHGVHLTKQEVEKISFTKTKLVHCPSSNLKLASGIAPIESYLKANIEIGLGADGAPCNNTLDPFLEMRLCALIQKPKFGSTALPAEKAFEMATIGGARVLGLESKIGSLEVGKFADIVIVDRSHPSCATVENPYASLVYSCSGRDVKHTWINGKHIVNNFHSEVIDSEKIIQQAKLELKKLLSRIN